MTHKGFSGTAGIAIIILTLLTCSSLIVTPVSAATKYLGGAPSFSATVYGVNEFTPGEDATISILVKNAGLNPLKQLNRGTIDAEDLPNTAKFVTIGLTSASDAVVIKTDPQMAGDISGNGQTVLLKFQAKISANATAGEYSLPLTIKYKYPRVIEQEAADTFEFSYNEAEDILPVTLRIKPQVKIVVIEAVPEGLSTGSLGYIDLKIRNIGPENGEMTSVKLLRNGQSPVIPSDSTLFLGSFPSGGIIECRYKVSVSNDATNQTYPVDIAVSYTNREGAIVTSSPETVGIFVNAKTAFTVISTVPEVPRGASRTIDVLYRNDGLVTVYDAEARITPHKPVTVTDNSAFLGDVEPGRTASARYEILADADSETMVYSFDSSIRYRDMLGNSHESDTIPVQIIVTPADSGSSGIPGGSPVLIGCVIGGIVICIAFLVYRMRMGNR
ncbi:MAG: S-layer protein [Methanomicrobiales archaeon]